MKAEDVPDEIVEVVARAWWEQSKAGNDKFFGPLGIDPEPIWDEISDSDREHVREDITRPHLEAAWPLIARQVLEEAADELEGGVPPEIYRPLYPEDHDRINAAISAAGYTRDAVSADARRLDARILRDIAGLMAPEGRPCSRCDGSGSRRAYDVDFVCGLCDGSGEEPEGRGGEGA